MKNEIIGIIGAMRVEMEALAAALENKKTEVVSDIEFHTGSLSGHDVVLAVCGVGKVFAATCAQTMILRYAPAVIVNSGVAGTLSNELSIGQIALADHVIQHDMDTSAVGDPVGLISGMDLIYIPTDKAVTAALAAAVRVPPSSARRPMRRRAGKRVSSGARNVSAPVAARSSGVRSAGRRSGHVNAYWIGTRISGGASCANVEPSVNVTNEWTIDSG